MHSPLDEEFDIETSKLLDGGDSEDIILPKIRDLDLIIEYALSQYQELLKDCAPMDAKSQLKAKELCRDFLREAKDAMDKKEKLKIAWTRLAKTQQKGRGGSEKDEEEEGDQPSGGGVSRSELARLARERAEQNQ